MENVIINPDNFQEEYIRYLNQCFHAWGGAREYDWVFKRVVGDRTSDIILLNDENGEIVAGSGITYRKMGGQAGGVFDIAIMTGSWTLPQARHKGYFSKIIQISREISHQKGVAYLTAFVTESNASSRRLKDAGAFLVPTSYLFSPQSLYEQPDNVTVSPVSHDREVLSAIYDQSRVSGKDFVHFEYTFPEFSHQYLKRPNRVEIIQIGSDHALIEETNDIIRVHLITYENLPALEGNLKALSNWVLENRAKRIFLFSTREETAELYDRLAFENKQGYFTILDTANAIVSDKNHFLRADIKMGDKM